FYFTPTFDGSGAGPLDTGAAPAGRGCRDVSGVPTIENPPVGPPPSSRTGCGAAALASLAATYTGGSNQAVLNDLGFFLRALSTVYSLEDGARLIQDTISILQMN